MANTDTPSSVRPDLRDLVVDTALIMAEEKGSWSAVRLHDVADRLSVPTPKVLDEYRDLDAVADAWFLRGLKAMLGPKPADFMDQPEWRRVEICMLAWFDKLSEHRAGERSGSERQASPFASASLGSYDLQSLTGHPMAPRGRTVARRVWHAPSTTRGGRVNRSVPRRSDDLDAR